MNRLKYVLGINFPCPFPSHICKKRHSDVRLSKSNRLLSSRARKINFGSLQYVRQQRAICGQQRNGSKSEFSFKKPPLENVLPDGGQRRRKATTCQIVKINSHHAERHNEKTPRFAKDEKNYATIVEPRTYAEMITRYNESGLGSLMDTVSATTINRIKRSPFSTASVISLIRDKKTKPTKRSSFRAAPGTRHQDAKFSIEAVVPCVAPGDAIRSVNELESTSSYVRMIEKYANNSVESWGNNRIPRRNVSTKLDGKKNDGVRSGVAVINGNTIPDTFTAAGRSEKHRRADWMMKMEDVIKDLKRITAKKDEADAKSQEKIMLRTMSERAHWLDRVVNAHKKQLEERRTAVGKTTPNAERGVETKNIASKRTTVSVSPKLEHSSSAGTKSPWMTTGEKPTNPISEYIKRGPVQSNPKSTAARTPTTTAATTAKEPKIELRMTPTRNESVVSINVDEEAKTGAKDRLSVVISSKRNSATDADTANRNTRSDFGSMQISISENTVPVKQIEFSINGRPVSELKSIVARADELDVVSSMDKVEIRIPSNNQIHGEKPKNPASPVLNLNIAATFNEPRRENPKEVDARPEASSDPSGRQFATPEPSKSHVLASEASKSPDASSSRNSNETSVERSKEIDGRIHGAVPVTKGVSKEEALDLADSSSMVKISDGLFASEISPKNPPSESSTVENLGTAIEDKIPSNMIPWWSSENSFKKIRKKSNAPVDSSAPKQSTEVVRIAPGIGTVSPEVSSDQPRDPAKASEAVTLGKDSEASESVDAKEKYDTEDVHVVRVRSSRWSAIGKHAKKPASNRKNTRHRVRTTSVEKEEETPTVSTARLPKVVRYAVVKPHVIDAMDQEPAKKDSSSPEIEAAKVEQEAKKYEEERPIARRARSSELRNVQNPKPVFEERERSANTSPDVSAEPLTSARGSSVERAKARGKEKTDSASGKDRNAEEVSDHGIDAILKGMKPIEKRKDGTLIDYGVTVPSRATGREKFGTTSRARRKSIDGDRTVVALLPVKSKVLEDETSTTKKQTTTETNSASSRSRIDDNRKEIIEKSATVSGKIIESTEKQTPTETRSKTLEDELSSKKQTSEVKSATVRSRIEEKSSKEEQTSTEPKGVEIRSKIVEELFSTKKQTPTEVKSATVRSRITREKLSSTEKRTSINVKGTETRSKTVEAKASSAKRRTETEDASTPDGRKIVEQKVLSTSQQPSAKSRGGPNRPKIVEAEQIISAKKQTLTEPKTATNRPKIVEREEISAAKKEATTEAESASNRPKIVAREKILATNERSLAEPEGVPNRPKIVEPEKIISSKKQTPTEPKGATNPPKIVEPWKLSSSWKQTPTKSKSASSRPRVESEKIISGKKQTLTESKNSKTVEPEKIFKKQTSSSSVECTPNRRKVIESKKSVEEENVGAKKSRETESKRLTISDEKKSATVDTIEGQAEKLAAVTVPKTKKDGVTKTENAPRKETGARVEKGSRNTGVAPLEGTIGRRSPSNEITTFSTVNKESETSAKTPGDRRLRSGEGRGRNGSDGPANGLVGPAGLPPPRSFATIQKTMADEVPAPTRCSDPRASLGKINETNKSTVTFDGRSKCTFFSDGTNGSEKHILHSLWLQRFKNKVDDDMTF